MSSIRGILQSMEPLFPEAVKHDSPAPSDASKGPDNVLVAAVEDTLLPKFKRSGGLFKAISSAWDERSTSVDALTHIDRTAEISQVLKTLKEGENNAPQSSPISAPAPDTRREVSAAADLAAIVPPVVEELPVFEIKPLPVSGATEPKQRTLRRRRTPDPAKAKPQRREPTKTSGKPLVPARTTGRSPKASTAKPTQALKAELPRSAAKREQRAVDALGQQLANHKEELRRIDEQIAAIDHEVDDRRRFLALAEAHIKSSRHQYQDLIVLRRAHSALLRSLGNRDA